MANLIPGLPIELARECLIRIPFQSFSSAILTCKDWKREIESSEYVLRRIVAGCSQHIMVMSQENIHNNFELGLRTIYRLAVWELKTRKWGELPPIPGFPNGMPTFCRLAVAGLNLVVIGSWLKRCRLVVSIGVYIYNFVSGTWRRGEDMPGARSLFVCTSDLDRMVYVVGGLDERESALRSALAYDVVEDKWVRLPDMVMACNQCNTFFQCGRLHVFSGYFKDGRGYIFMSFEAFDPATWTWGPVQHEFMESNNCPRPIVAGEDGRYYSCQGGCVAMLEKGEWVKVVDLPVYLRDSSCLMAWKRYFVVFGCAGLWFRRIPKMYLLDLETKQWTDIRVPMDYATQVEEVCCLEI